VIEARRCAALCYTKTYAGNCDFGTKFSGRRSVNADIKQGAHLADGVNLEQSGVNEVGYSSLAYLACSGQHTAETNIKRDHQTLRDKEGVARCQGPCSAATSNA